MNISLMSKDLDTKKAEASALLTAQMTAAEKDNRERTAEEIASVDAKLDECRALKARIDRAQGEANQLAEIERMSGGLPVAPSSSETPARRERRSLGQQFVESSEYRALIKAASSPRRDLGAGRTAGHGTGELSGSGGRCSFQQRPHRAVALSTADGQ